MPVESAGLNSAADGFKAAYAWIALFNGNPTSGGTEISGGSPAYARKAAAWGASAAGAVSIGGALTFDIPSGATVTHWGAMSASTAGTRGASGAFAASEGPYGAQGTYQITALTVDFD